ncbi:MAG: hypothetical protein ACXWEY_07165 [Bacteroidia bacterium]
MRKYSLFMLATGIFLLASCNNEKASKVVAEKFLKAYSSRKYEEANQYATKHTQRMVNLTSILSKNAPKNQVIKEYEILDCQEVGNKATVKYKIKGSATSETMYLVKKDETWLVGLEN